MQQASLAAATCPAALCEANIVLHAQNGFSMDTDESNSADQNAGQVDKLYDLGIHSVKDHRAPRVSSCALRSFYDAPWLAGLTGLMALSYPERYRSRWCGSKCKSMQYSLINEVSACNVGGSLPS